MNLNRQWVSRACRSSTNAMYEFFRAPGPVLDFFTPCNLLSLELLVTLYILLATKEPTQQDSFLKRPADEKNTFHNKIARIWARRVFFCGVVKYLSVKTQKLMFYAFFTCWKFCQFLYFGTESIPGLSRGLLTYYFSKFWIGTVLSDSLLNNPRTAGLQSGFASFRQFYPCSCSLGINPVEHLFTRNSNARAPYINWKGFRLVCIGLPNKKYHITVPNSS